MDFFQAYDKIKKAFDGTDVSAIDCHLAIQINIAESDASGMCYIEVNEGKLYVEPYNYYDNDAVFTVTVKELVKLATGKQTYEKAIESGALSVSGNLEKAAMVKLFKPKEKEEPRGRVSKKITVSAKKELKADEKAVKPEQRPEKKGTAGKKRSCKKKEQK